MQRFRALDGARCGYLQNVIYVARLDPGADKRFKVRVMISELSCDKFSRRVGLSLKPHRPDITSLRYRLDNYTTLHTCNRRRRRRCHRSSIQGRLGLRKRRLLGRCNQTSIVLLRT